MLAPKRVGTGCEIEVNKVKTQKRMAKFKIYDFAMSDRALELAFLPFKANIILKTGYFNSINILSDNSYKTKYKSFCLAGIRLS